MFIVASAIRAAEVDGRVINLYGEPVIGARVNGADHDHPSVGEVSYVTTDSEGKFKLSLPPGEYNIYAQKAEAGYGDTEFAFFSYGRPPAPRIKVSAAQEAPAVTGKRGHASWNAYS